MLLRSPRSASPAQRAHAGVQTKESYPAVLTSPSVSGLEHDRSLTLCDLLLSAAFLALSPARREKHVYLLV